MKQAEQNLSIAALAPEIRTGAILAMIFYEILNLVNFHNLNFYLATTKRSKLRVDESGPGSIGIFRNRRGCLDYWI